MTLAGRWGDAGWPPKRPSKLGSTFDERDLADEVETLGQGQRGYELLVQAAVRFLAPPYGSRPVERDPIEREEKRQMRELRLELDRFRLEESLGFDTDLIKRLEA